MSQSNTLVSARYETVRLRDLVTDGRFNRKIYDPHVEKLMSDFDITRLGCLSLSWREDGVFVILDGQHRVEALRRMGVREDLKCIPAQVHRGLTVDQEARLVVELNASKIFGAPDKYVALLAAGDLETTAIDEIVRAQGLTVDRGSQDGRIGCIDALRKLYRLGEPKGAVLGQTLATLYSAWGLQSQAYASSLVRGVGVFFNGHRDAKPGDLAEALVRGPGAPINLIGWAKAIAGTQRMPLDQAIAKIIADRVIGRRHRPRKTASA